MRTSDEPQREIHTVAVDHPDARALLDAYFAELRARLAAYDAPSLDELQAERGVTLVAYDGGRPVGCGAVRLLDSETAEVKRMFIAPDARGRGHARALLVALEKAAVELGCRRVVLDTAAPLTEAVAMYVRAGYGAIDRYNDNPVAAHWFEKMLGGRE